MSKNKEGRGKLFTMSKPKFFLDTFHMRKKMLWTYMYIFPIVLSLVNYSNLCHWYVTVNWRGIWLLMPALLGAPKRNWQVESDVSFLKQQPGMLAYWPGDWRDVLMYARIYKLKQENWNWFTSWALGAAGCRWVHCTGQKLSLFAKEKQGASDNTKCPGTIPNLKWQHQISSENTKH